MPTMHQHYVDSNGVRLHVSEAGQGHLVLLCHGFPEFSWSWRHQIQALAEAGYRVVAPDQRGYGKSDCPEAVEDYDISQLCGDLVGLVHALGESRAIIVGHDFGAQIAYHCALLRADIFYGIALLSVPYIPRSWKNIPSTEVMRRMAGDKQFYQLYFQEPGKAERELDADVRRSVLMFLYSASGSVAPDQRWRFLFDRDETLLDTGTVPDVLPDWLCEDDVDRYTEAFQRTGFRGAINWYRNIDRNWAITSYLNGAKLQQPALFIAGDADVVVTMRRTAIDALADNVPNLQKSIIVPGAGHWIQQEAPATVNRYLIDFCNSLAAKES